MQQPAFCYFSTLRDCASASITLLIADPPVNQILCCGLQTENLLSHSTLPKLHLSKCRGGRLAVRCNALRELVVKVGVVHMVQHQKSLLLQTTERLLSTLGNLGGCVKQCEALFGLH